MNQEPSNFFLRQRGKYWYVQFKIPNTGRWTTAKSTGTRDKLEALKIVLDWANNGIPTKKPEAKTALQDYIKSKGILSTIKEAQLDKEDAEEIVRIL